MFFANAERKADLGRATKSHGAASRVRAGGADSPREKRTRVMTVDLLRLGRIGLLAAASALAATAASAQTAIKFSLDFKFEGPAAPFVVAIDKGYFKAEGLDVTIDTAGGSLRSEEHTSELQSHVNLVCRLLL